MVHSTLAIVVVPEIDVEIDLDVVVIQYRKNRPSLPPFATVSCFSSSNVGPEGFKSSTMSALLFLPVHAAIEPEPGGVV